MNPSVRVDRKQSKYSFQIKCRTQEKTYGYDHINTDGLTKERLQDFYILKGFKKYPSIIDFPNKFTIQYDNKPPIVLDKPSGTIFGDITANYDEKYINFQLEKLLKVLRLDNRVEGYTVYTKNLKRRKSSRTVPFVGDGDNDSSGNSV
jgi:hypothetical protein